jgi:hypothetical protein
MVHELQEFYWVGSIAEARGSRPIRVSCRNAKALCQVELTVGFGRQRITS